MVETAGGAARAAAEKAARAVVGAGGAALAVAAGKVARASVAGTVARAPVAGTAVRVALVIAATASMAARGERMLGEEPIDAVPASITTARRGAARRAPSAVVRGPVGPPPPSRHSGARAGPASGSSHGRLRCPRLPFAWRSSTRRT